MNPVSVLSGLQALVTLTEQEEAQQRHGAASHLVFKPTEVRNVRESNINPRGTQIGIKLIERDFQSQYVTDENG